MTDWPETSESLILRVKDPADGAAWSAFLAVYRPVVYRLARSRGLQDADAEDLSQQVFASIARAVEGWEPADGRPPFRAWLYRIARNEVVKAITRRKPDLAAGSSSVQMQLNEVPQREEHATSELIRESRQEAFRWAAAEIRPEFSESTWGMFWDSTVDGKPVKEVASAYQRTAGVVYLARYRVMQRLKEKLEEVSDIWSDVT